uniref:RNA exonuclease 1 n=1 Tax=Bactrocera latifrons TaxID=174628 RepID=A0A0K8WCF2_BACLA
MLPSLGLFKGFPCPYFTGTNSKNQNTGTQSCQRPYCHFKHVRKDENQTTNNVSVPEYKPSPKLLPLPTITKSKPKLEYQPEKPALNASPSKPPLAFELRAPIYIPATCKNDDNELFSLNLDDCEEELNELGEILETEVVKDVRHNGEIPSNTRTEDNQNKINNAEEGNIIISKKDVISNEENKSSRRSSKDIKQKTETPITKDTSVSKDRSLSKESRLKIISKEENKNIHKTENRKHKESRHEEHSKKDDRRHKHEKDYKNTSSSKSSSSKSRPSSTLSEVKEGSKSRSKSKKSSKSNHISSNKIHRESKISTPVDPISPHTSTESIEQFPITEEINKECQMIYEQLEKDFASMHKDNNGELKSSTNESKALKRHQSQEDEYVTNSLQKKRVAYHNADKLKVQSPLLLRKPDHIRNAMQAIFNRQSAMHRKREEEATVVETAVREAEEKVREATEALRKAKEKSQSQLTPLIPKSYLTPPPRITRTIAPVANIIALERAKKKVEELRAGKQPAFTPAQTTKKGERVAHKITAALATKEAIKPAKPPVLEANSSKISFNIRMQYYEMMVKHCLAIYPNMADAWERAQTEELAVLKKCNTPVIYKSSALLAINKLRKEATDSGNKPADTNRMLSHEVILAGKLAKTNTWSVQKKIRSDASDGNEPFDKLPGDKAYDMVYELRLTEEQLTTNGFPRPGNGPGIAIITSTRPSRRPNVDERYCSRCGKVFNLKIYDEICVDECNYHPKSAGYRRGFADNHHRCCQQPAGTPGCSYANYHVADYVDYDNLTGYITTIKKDGDYIPTKKDIYALDCEMCYTTMGIELTRVTVVDINGRTVYDALVKPENKIVDYNTVYSGINEAMLKCETRTLRDVQAILMSMFHSKTILTGHSLDSDLKALKLIHSVVVDTSVLFPHKMGPPKKRALKTLCIENLKRIIQENEAGHDSAEDAEVCIQLVKFYLRNKIS